MTESEQKSAIPFDRYQRFMTPKEVAKELKISYLHTLDLIHAKEHPLPAHKFGRVYRIERGELERYLQSTKVKPKPNPLQDWNLPGK